MAKPPITARPHVFYIRPAPGWLDVTCNEVYSVLNSSFQKYKFEARVTKLKSTVKLHRCDFRQGLEVMARLNTAHDVEWVVEESKCLSWTNLEFIFARVQWSDLSIDKNTLVHAAVELTDGFTSSSTKIRDKFCTASGWKHVSENEQIRLKIELRKDILRIIVSLAGEPLYKRKYKKQLSAVAPLPEHQAAACIQWILQDFTSANSIQQVFVPFAGSGTFGFEALIYFRKGGPGAFDRVFSCESFPCVPVATIRFLKRKLSENMQQEMGPQILFNDFNEQAMTTLEKNVEAFAYPFSRKFIQGDAFSHEVDFQEGGLVLLNPPYGERLASQSDILNLYKRLGKMMKKMGVQSQKQIVGGCICPDDQTLAAFSNSLGCPNKEVHPFSHGGKLMRIVRWITKKE